MKIKLLILSLLVCMFASAQYTPPVGYTNINSRYDWLAGVFRALGLPAGGNAAFTTGQAQRAGTVYYDSTGADAGLKVWTGLAWVDVGQDGGFFSPNQTAIANTTHNAAWHEFRIDSLKSFTATSPLSAGGSSGFLFDTLTAVVQTAQDATHRAGFRTGQDPNNKWVTLIDASDSIQLSHNVPVVNISDSANWYMMVQRKHANGTIGKAYWPVGVGGATDDTTSLSNRIDANFHQTEAIDDTSFVIKRPNGTQDTIVISVGNPSSEEEADTIAVSYVVAASDETTDLTTGTAKVTFRMPHAMTITEVRASVNTASSSGTPTVDINENGTTILSTKITIDVGEKTSFTAASPAVISDAALADDAEITIDIDVAGTGAKGLKVVIKGTRP